jgi:hypothetical protein
MIKSKRMRWEGYVTRMRRRGMHLGFWRKSQRETDHYKDLDVVGRIILKRTLKKWDGVAWTGFIWLKRGIIGELLWTR